jgi:hypothetical protein
MTAMLTPRAKATNETRKVGKQSGGDSACAVSGGDSVEVRVHLYERSVPEEPDTRARAVMGGRAYRRSTRAPRSTVSPALRRLAG